jgi:hypothetical protein
MDISGDRVKLNVPGASRPAAPPTVFQVTRAEESRWLPQEQNGMMAQ